MLLYDSAVAPNPRRVRIFLAEKGVSVPRRQVDLARLEQRDAAFATLNPLQHTPVLVLDDGTAISESVAICRYFEELHPTPALFGHDTMSRVMVEMWQRRVELGLMARVQAVFRNTHPAMREMEKPQVPAVADAARPKVRPFLEVLDAALATQRYVAGDAFTIADITALVTIDFMRYARLEVPGELAHLARWRAETSARPSAAA